MKKQLMLVLIFVSVILSSCSSQSNDTYVYWTEKTDNQIQRLNQAKIKYEIRHGDIWIREKDNRKVVACCS